MAIHLTNEPKLLSTQSFPLMLFQRLHSCCSLFQNIEIIVLAHTHTHKVLHRYSLPAMNSIFPKAAGTQTAFVLLTVNTVSWGADPPNPPKKKEKGNPALHYP